MPLDSPFYVARPTDCEFKTAIQRRDSIVLVKGARQMGKTSLLARGLEQARQDGNCVVLTDFQTLDAAELESTERLFLALAERIADQLDLEVLPEEVWKPYLGPSANFERYLVREVLSRISAPLVWGLDEVDCLFPYDYSSQVFGQFRSWHNQRGLEPTGPWPRLTLAMACATEAHLFIKDLNQSPFNVGTRVTLQDFTRVQVSDLNRRCGMPLRDEAELTRFYHLVHGHPYLVSCGLHEMAARDLTLEGLVEQVNRDEGIYSDHLRRILVLLIQNPDLCEAVRAVLQGRSCPTEESFYRLRSAGVLVGDSSYEARPRCRLYETYLGSRIRE